MDKAFDTADLKARLVAKGLPALEGIAELVAAEVFAWTKDSLAIHPNSMVKAIGLPAVAILEPLTIEAVDKIDGKQG